MQEVAESQHEATKVSRSSIKQVEPRGGIANKQAILRRDTRLADVRLQTFSLPPKVYARIRAGDSHQAIMDSIAESLQVKRQPRIRFSFLPLFHDTQNRFRLFRVTVKRQLAEGGSGDRKVPVCQEFMATPSREKLAKKLLNHQATPSGSGGMSKRRHPSTLNLPQRGHHLQRLPSPTEQQLQQRESGWNDRFFYEQPINSNKLPRPDRTPASPQKQSAAAVQHRKEKKVRNERLQYGKRSDTVHYSIAVEPLLFI